MIAGAVVLQLFALIYFQRLAIPIGGAAISVPLVVTGMALAALAAIRRLTFSRTRLMLFAAMGAAGALSQAVVPGPVSVASLAYLLALYLVHTVRLEMDGEAYLAVWRSYSAMMVVPALLVFVQYGWQLHAGQGSGLGMDFLFPRQLLLPGYVYRSSTDVWLTWDRPNGIFFLEPSFCSAFLAAAFLNEALVLRRRGFATLFLAALMLCGAATGLILVVIAIAWRLRASTSAWIAIISLGLLIIALIDSSSQFAAISRLAELSDPGSSGYDRLVRPLASFYQVVGDAGGWLTGHGAGQITAASGNAWPLVKLTYEYGLPTAVAWLALFLAATWGRRNVGYRIAVLFVFQFTGGYLLSPIMVLFAALTCGMCAVASERDSRQPSWPRGFAKLGVAR